MWSLHTSLYRFRPRAARFPFISETPSLCSERCCSARSTVVDPVYIVEAPVTFVVKLLVGMIAGLIAHRLGHISTQQNQRKLTQWVVIASAAGLLFNTFADPGLRYLYKLFILGRPAAEVTFAINFTVTAINAAVSLVITVLLYLALRVPLKKAGLFFRLR